MKFTKSPAQTRVLERFWQTQQPFTLEDLVQDRIWRTGFFARLGLHFMLQKSQIIPYAVDRYFRVQYVATTRSQAEWKQLATYRSPPCAIVEFEDVLRKNYYENLIDFMVMQELLDARKHRRTGNGAGQTRDAV